MTKMKRASGILHYLVAFVNIRLNICENNKFTLGNNAFYSSILSYVGGDGRNRVTSY